MPEDAFTIEPVIDNATVFRCSISVLGPAEAALALIRGRYRFRLLVHGARAAVRTAKLHDDALSCWIQNLNARKHTNVVVVALANKTARMAWAMIHNDVDYEPQLAASAATS